MTTFGPIGSLTQDDGENVITFVRTYPVSPERLWRALSTAEGLASWLAPTVAIDGRRGGAVEMAFDEENLVTGVVTAWEPHTILAHSWIINGEVHSELRYELEPTDDGTRLTLVHTRLPDAMSSGYAPGWHAYLARLDAVLAGEAPPTWDTVFAAVAPHYR